MLKKLFSIILIAICAFSIVSCKKEEEQEKAQIESIQIVESSIPSEILLTEIEEKITQIELSVKYDDGTTKTEKVSKNMISSADFAKLSTAGTYTITVTYEGFTASLNLNIVEPVDKYYSVKVVYPDGTPVNGGVAVQWCSTYCLLPISINSEGIAKNELEDDTYYVHIDEIPAGYTYNPNAYVATPDNKHLVITLDKLNEVENGDGTTANPYTVVNGAYKLTFDASGKNAGQYFSFTATESKKVTITSTAVDKLAMNEIDPYLGFIGQTDDLPNFSLANADVSGNKDSKVDINFTYTFDAVAGETYYFLVFVSKATSFPAEFNIYVK